MLTSEGSTTNLQPDRATSEVSSGLVEGRDDPQAGPAHQAALALGFTTAILAFVGAIVVLMIPYAVLSVPLPPDVNRLGLSVEITRRLLFAHPWYLVALALLIALWTGYKSYRWYRSTIMATPDESAAESVSVQPSDIGSQ